MINLRDIVAIEIVNFSEKLIKKQPNFDYILMIGRLF